MVRDNTLSSRIIDVIIIGILLLLVVVTLYPLYYVLIVSLSDGGAVLRGEVGLLPVGFTLDSYVLVFEDPSILRSLGNSVLYTSVGTFINLAMTAMCAYPLARVNFSGRKVFTWVVTVPLFFSGGLIPLYLVVLHLGLINTMWAVILPTAITPWYVFLMRTYFQGIHSDIYEAATVDGANELQIFLRIVLPISKPILATMFLFYAVAHWNDYFNALIFLDDKSRFPLQLIMRNIVLGGQFEQTNDMSTATDFTVIEETLKFAVIIVSVLPILVVYPFLQRYFTQGIMVGSIKG